MLAPGDERAFVLFPSEARLVTKQWSLVDKCRISFVRFLELSCLVLFPARQSCGVAWTDE